MSLRREMSHGQSDRHVDDEKEDDQGARLLPHLRLDLGTLVGYLSFFSGHRYQIGRDDAFDGGAHFLARRSHCREHGNGIAGLVGFVDFSQLLQSIFGRRSAAGNNRCMLGVVPDQILEQIKLVGHVTDCILISLAIETSPLQIVPFGGCYDIEYVLDQSVDRIADLLRMLYAQGVAVGLVLLINQRADE